MPRDVPVLEEHLDQLYERLGLTRVDIDNTEMSFSM
jgi:hypothetical protein